MSTTKSDHHKINAKINNIFNTSSSHVGVTVSLIHITFTLAHRLKQKEIHEVRYADRQARHTVLLRPNYRPLMLCNLLLTA